MLKFIGFVMISLLLILLILLRVPQESAGLSSFATKSNLLGSPRSAERFLNILTVVGIVIYFKIAFTFNLRY